MPREYYGRTYRLFNINLDSYLTIPVHIRNELDGWYPGQAVELTIADSKLVISLINNQNFDYPHKLTLLSKSLVVKIPQNLISVLGWNIQDALKATPMDDDPERGHLDPKGSRSIMISLRDRSPDIMRHKENIPCSSLKFSLPKHLENTGTIFIWVDGEWRKIIGTNLKLMVECKIL